VYLCITQEENNNIINSSKLNDQISLLKQEITEYKGKNTKLESILKENEKEMVKLQHELRGLKVEYHGLKDMVCVYV
jgi:septal ring factor EnvC (AmiA/AmiB activator)